MIPTLCGVFLLVLALIGLLWMGIITVYVATFIYGCFAAWWSR